jgi:hypothetical protein
MDVGKLRFLFTALSSLFGQCSAVSYSWHKHHVFGLLDVAYRIMTSVFSATWWKKTIITFSWVVQLSTSSGALSLVGPVYPRLFLQLDNLYDLGGALTIQDFRSRSKIG